MILIVTSRYYRFLNSELLRQLNRKDASKRSDTDHWLWPLLGPLIESLQILDTISKVGNSDSFVFPVLLPTLTLPKQLLDIVFELAGFVFMWSRN